MELSPHKVIVRPVITEKSTFLSGQNKYVFEVAPEANKIQVRQAVEALFPVNVVSVNIVRVPAKERRLGRHRGMTRPWKKAIVTVRPGQRIELYQGV